jgi:uncharacterized protein with HEPN domain
MKKDDAIYLNDIQEAILRIEDYIKDGRDTFMETPMIQDAVIRNFEIIGEATKNLSEDIKQDNSDIPWRQMAGLRDVLIHAYRRVQLTRVWNVIEQNLPQLKQRVQNLLNQSENE